MLGDYAKFVGLRAFNFVLTSVWGFGLVYALTAELDIAGYAKIAVIAAIAAYVVSADLGFSAFMYDRLRRAFIHGQVDQPNSMLMATICVYFAVALASTSAFAAYVIFFDNETVSVPSHTTIGFFFSAVLGLPWMPLRAAALATDRMVPMESIEVSRRLANLALVFWLAGTLDFSVFVVLSLMVWVASYWAAAVLLLPLLSGSPFVTLAGFKEMASSLASLKHTFVFSAAESFVYLFPYFLIPAAIANPLAIVSFDLFFRVVRFCSTAYLALSEAAMPMLTRAFHKGDFRALKKYLLVIFLVAIVIATNAVVLIGPMGDIVFGFLLGDSSIVADPTRRLMIAMLVAMLFQTISGAFLLNTGHSRELRNISLGCFAAMVCLGAVVMLLQTSFDFFLLAYVLIFASGSAAYLMLLWTKVFRAGGSEN